MAFDLRYYQTETVETVFDLMLIKHYILACGPCGSGKTIIFNEIAQRYLAKYPHNKVAIITRIGTLVMQTHDKFMQAFPGSVFGVVGIASKKISATVEVDKPVTIATIQTLVNCQPKKPFDLIVIDEVHQLNTRDKASQIQKFLLEQEAKNPNLKVVGFTATPYRLGSGFIYGDRVRPGCTNWFDDLDYQITMEELEQHDPPYLVPHICLEVKNIAPDIENVPKNNAGDYVSGQLSERLRKKRHIQSAVMAVKNYAEGRRHIAVFCVDIAHAEAVKTALTAEYITAETVHSKKEENDNVAAIRAFESGRCRCLVSVESLTTGFDSTCIDCILFLRPTQSPALFVQMFGRGKRPHEGKVNCLMLDMAALFRTHGNPNDPEIIVPVKTKKALKDKTEVCEECKFVIYDDILKRFICANKQAKEYRHFVQPDHSCDLWQKKSTVRICEVCKKAQFRPFSYSFCQVCGAPFKDLIKKPKPKHKEDNEWYEMGEVDVDKKPVVVAVSGCDIKRHKSKSGNIMLKMVLKCYGRTGTNIYVNEYFSFYSPPGTLLYKKGARIFQRFAGKVPRNDEDALQMKSAVLANIPDSIRVIKKNNFWRMVA